MQSVTTLSFEAIALATLTTLDGDQLDTLPFGVVGLSPEGMVEVYNVTESKLAGLPRDSVVGTHYFSVTAQCMNNFMVAQRMEDEVEIDATIDYVLTCACARPPCACAC